MTISEQAAAQAIRLLQATAKTGQLKPRQSRADFGGPDSYRLKVRRIGRNYPFGSDIQDGDFGIFLGLHDEGYLVALQTLVPGNIIGYEQFHSLAALKANWELD
jgi:hypothetical protein